ncbi:MAG: hypothetical protein EPO52_17565 [Herbiconiux sp.]|uniref:helix-turn-helix domain-containing protein n=1 Tax=Herbiconiux sp. TaxID=1871186 RepID=UPI00121A24D7|nr:helix-turn-helix domain-containing protein [Herbiconiux sp.]TAJ46341.1 MAG: hypothetical protein EPO52_17565 [Herbiconiux sp.]
MNRSLYRSRNSFAQISWDLVKVLDGDVVAAAIFDWIAWKCESEFAPVDDNDDRWYPISYPSLSAVTGVSEKTIRTTIAKLIDAGHLRSTQLRRNGSYDQTRSYAPVWSEGVPSGADASALTQGVPVGADGPAPQGGSDLPLRADVPLIGELSNDVIEDCASDDAVVIAVVVDTFDEFWSEYPIRKGKKPARLAYEKALTRTTPEKILAGVRAYVASLGPNPDPSKVKWAQGWLNDDRWDDEYVSQPNRALTNAEIAAADWMARYGGDDEREGDARSLDAALGYR